MFDSIHFKSSRIFFVRKKILPVQLVKGLHSQDRTLKDSARPKTFGRFETRQLITLLGFWSLLISDIINGATTTLRITLGQITVGPHDSWPKWQLAHMTVGPNDSWVKWHWVKWHLACRPGGSMSSVNSNKTFLG